MGSNIYILSKCFGRIFSNNSATASFVVRSFHSARLPQLPTQKARLYNRGYRSLCCFDPFNRGLGLSKRSFSSEIPQPEASATHASLEATHPKGPIVTPLKKTKSKPLRNTISEHEIREVNRSLPDVCCGCGVRLQRSNPEAPGYFTVSDRFVRAVLERIAERAPPPPNPNKKRKPWESKTSTDVESDVAALVAAAEGEEEESANAEYAAARQQFNMRATHYASEEKQRKERLPEVTCQRCQTLKYENRVPSEALEATPTFDLGRRVARKIALQKDRRAVVVVVVDVLDFDGSLPREAIQSLFDDAAIAANQRRAQLLVALTKIDLLPPMSNRGGNLPANLIEWSRRRLAQAGVPPSVLSGIFPISNVSGDGVRTLAAAAHKLIGLRGDLWVVGAQNAGKSSLIVSLKRLAGTAEVAAPTVAPVPGTTWDIVKVEGLPFGSKKFAYDTPGVQHSHQLTSRLSVDEVKAILPRRQLKPRTFRIGVGQSILIGGVGRIDVVKTPSATIYLTVFVNNWIPLHFGRTETAAERRAKHAGKLLTPPLTPERAAQLPALVDVEIPVRGNDWRRHSVDIAIAGLGWIGVGVLGDALLRVWTFPGVAISRRDALLPEYGVGMQRPGFSKNLPCPPLADEDGVRPSAAKAAHDRRKRYNPFEMDGRRVTIERVDGEVDDDEDEDEGYDENEMGAVYIEDEDGSDSHGGYGNNSSRDVIDGRHVEQEEEQVEVEERNQRRVGRKDYYPSQQGTSSGGEGKGKEDAETVALRSLNSGKDEQSKEDEQARKKAAGAIADIVAGGASASSSASGVSLS